MTRGENTTRIGIRIQDEALDRLSGLAAKSNMSIGSYLRLLLEQDVPARYLYLLELGTAGLETKFTASELSLMCDVCNGTWWQPAVTIQNGILYDCEDTEPEIYEKWKVDRAPFLAKLRTLPVLEQFALVAAVERFWRRVSNDEQPTPGEILD